MQKRVLEDLKFDGQATYHICIRGALEEHWSDYLGGMRITTGRQGDGTPITNLNGRMVDQAALVGVLNALYDMHLTIISVERLAQESGT